jgi:hypothetical protein
VDAECEYHDAVNVGDAVFEFNLGHGTSILGDALHVVEKGLEGVKALVVAPASAHLRRL